MSISSQVTKSAQILINVTLFQTTSSISYQLGWILRFSLSQKTGERTKMTAVMWPLVALLCILGLQFNAASGGSLDGCAGNCGGNAGTGCMCDDACTLNKTNCCPDYQEMCLDSNSVVSGRFFDCRRENHGCTINGQCNDEGTCICKPGFFAVHWNCMPDRYLEMTCTRQCENNGRCFDGYLQICICPPDYLGLTCQLKVFHTTCTDSGMQITFRSRTDVFAGVVYAAGHKDDSTCMLNFIGVQIPNSIKLAFYAYDQFTKTIPLANCGMQRHTLPNGSTRFTLEMIIQYSSNETDILLATDQSIVSTCTFAPNRTLTTATQVKADLEAGGGSGTVDYSSVVTMDLQTGSNDTVQSSAPLPVGQQMFIIITVRDNEISNSSRLENCVAHNRVNLSDAATVQVPVVTEGCVVKNVITAGNVSLLVSSDGSSIYTVPVKTVMFTAGSINRRNQLHFTCIVRLCGGYRQSCTQPTPDECAGADSNREKRQVPGDVADDEELPDVVVTGSVNVAFVDDKPSKSTREITAECLKKSPLQNVIIVLCLMIFLLLVVCVTFGVLLTLDHRRQHKDRSPAPTKLAD